MIVKKGANYGYSLREGPQAMTTQGMAPVPADDTIPVQITDTVTRGTVKPTYPVIAYPHTDSGGDAIAGGFIYRGTRIPALKGKLLFGDITTGRIWYADMADVLRGRRWRPDDARADSRAGRRSSPSRGRDIPRRGAATATRCPGPPPYRVAAAWTCASRKTAPASSTS